MSEQPDNTGREQDGRFKKGHSGNPAGMKSGSRHAVTKAVEALLDGDAEALTRKAINMALAGDVTALRLCLERIAPIRKGRTVQLSLPEIDTPQDVLRATTAILRAVADGELTPEEASGLAGLVEGTRKGIETIQLSERLSEIEQELQQRGAKAQ